MGITRALQRESEHLGRSSLKHIFNLHASINYVPQPLRPTQENPPSELQPHCRNRMEYRSPSLITNLSRTGVPASLLRSELPFQETTRSISSP